LVAELPYSLQEKIKKMIKEQWPKAVRSDSGLYSQVEQKGEGKAPAAGTTIKAHLYRPPAARQPQVRQFL